MSLTDTPESIKQEIRGYLIIFGGLLSLSFLTVGLSYMKLPLSWAIFLTLLIASIQVYLAAGYFMHLLSEKAIVIYMVLAMTGAFAIAILALPSIESHNTITGTTYTHSQPAKATAEHTADSAHTEEHVP